MLGMENKRMVFLFTDQHVVEEGKYVSRQPLLRLCQLLCFGEIALLLSIYITQCVFFS